MLNHVLFKSIEIHVYGVKFAARTQKTGFLLFIPRIRSVLGELFCRSICSARRGEQVTAQITLK